MDEGLGPGNEDNVSEMATESISSERTCDMIPLTLLPFQVTPEHSQHSEFFMVPNWTQ